MVECVADALFMAVRNDKTLVFRSLALVRFELRTSRSRIPRFPPCCQRNINPICPTTGVRRTSREEDENSIPREAGCLLQR